MLKIIHLRWTLFWILVWYPKNDMKNEFPGTICVLEYLVFTKQVQFVDYWYNELFYI